MHICLQIDYIVATVLSLFMTVVIFFLNFWFLLQIFTCFGVSLYYQLYIGYAIVSLMAEVNSIFLHGRQLLLMNGYAKSSSTYFVNSIVNVFTYIVFRLGVLSWMAWWLSQHTHELPITMTMLAAVGLFIMLTVNFVLFTRLMVSDFLSDQRFKDVMDK